MTEPPARELATLLSATDEQAADSGARSGIRFSRARDASLPSSPHAERFRLAVAVLAVLSVGAVAIAFIAAHGGRHATRPWSAFKPQFGGDAGALEIANYIAPGYRIAPAQQLAVISVSGSLNGATVVLKEGPSDGNTEILNGNTLVYQFCGLGPSCTIPGKPSPGRLDLVRYEAFEVSLYALHYLGNIDNVVTILPPAFEQPAGSSGGTPTLATTPPASIAKPVRTVVAQAVTRNMVKSLLSQPVTRLYSSRPPALGGALNAQDIATVDYITADQLFTPSSETASDGTQYLILSQLPAQ